MTQLEGKVVVVTGAGRGLGKVIALAVAHAGGDVVLAARGSHEILQTKREIEMLGRKALAIVADVTKREDVTMLLDSAIAKFQKIDVLINNAGQNAAYANYPFEDIPEQEWEELIRINVNGVFLVTQILGKTMLNQGFGKVINVGSLFGVKGMPGKLCYSVSKAAIIHMTKTLALEWADRGVTVNCICPGSFDRLPDSNDPEHLKMNKERKARVPLGRLVEPKEVGALITYLASGVSDYMTGQTVVLDGGWAVS